MFLSYSSKVLIYFIFCCGPLSSFGQVVQGTITYAEGYYSGDLVKGNREGKGTYTWTNGDKYEGHWKNNIKHGEGTYIWITGEKYTGEWKNDKKDGMGQYKFASGETYDGHFKNNLREGYGTFMWPDSNTYSGLWHKGNMHGKGCTRGQAAMCIMACGRVTKKKGMEFIYTPMATDTRVIGRKIASMDKVFLLCQWQ